MLNSLLRKPESARLAAVCDHAATSGRGGVVGQNEPPAKDMAALLQAVLGFYEDSVRLSVVPPSGRVPPRVPRRPARRLQWLKLLLLLVPVLLIGLVRMVVTGRAREAMARQQRAVSLYRQLSGKDPRVAEAEVRRITDQLRAIDERVRPQGDRSGPVGAADRAELEAAAGALLAYHLGGRQTNDALLGETQAAWVEVEAFQQELQERVLLQVGRGRQAVRAAFTRREREGLSRQMQATMDRYLAGWRSWLDWHAGQDGSPDRDH
jgi:hypothetical protein